MKLFAGNSNQPGQIRIGAVGTQPISGSGILARVNGTEQGSAVVFLGFTAKLSDSSGKSIPVRTAISIITKNESPADSAAPPIDQPVDQPVDSSPPTRGAGSVTYVSRGQGNAPSPRSTTESPPPVENSTPGADSLPSQEVPPQIDSAIAERPSVPYIDKQTLTFLSVLEAFESYDGPRTFAGMSALFKNDSSPLQQRPEILLADGKTPVEIRFPLTGKKELSSELKNARLIRSGFVDENLVVVRCIPEDGATSAKIFLLGGEELIEIPLTVAPRISLAGLAVKPEEILPKLDVDSDGESTWEDDYILVANLLDNEQKSKKLVDGKTEP